MRYWPVGDDREASSAEGPVSGFDHDAVKALVKAYRERPTASAPNALEQVHPQAAEGARHKPFPGHLDCCVEECAASTTNGIKKRSARESRLRAAMPRAAQEGWGDEMRRVGRSITKAKMTEKIDPKAPDETNITSGSTEREARSKRRN